MLTENGLPVCNSPLCLRRAVEDGTRPLFNGEFVRVNLPAYNGKTYKVVGLSSKALMNINTDDDIPLFANNRDIIPIGLPLETECVDWKEERLGIFPDAIMRPGYAHLYGFDSHQRWLAIATVLQGWASDD